MITLSNISIKSLAPAQLSHPPTFTGSLELYMARGMGPIVRQLLSLPGGLHFRKLALKWFREEEVLLTMELVDKCSHTLESLEINCNPRGMFIHHLHRHQ